MVQKDENPRFRGLKGRQGERKGSKSLGTMGAEMGASRSLHHQENHSGPACSKVKFASHRKGLLQKFKCA